MTGEIQQFCSFVKDCLDHGRIRTHFVIRRTSVEVLEGSNDVLAEARRKHIFVLPKLVA